MIKFMKKEKYKITTPISYYSPRYKKWIEIPPHTSDGYTMVPDTPDIIPSYIHDYCYHHQKWADGSKMYRKQADRCLFDSMKYSHCKTTRILARLYYIGVRTAGWIFW